jgi:hypothetical protein
MPWQASQTRYNACMPPKKTATLNLRIDPILKEAAREAAIREHRSVANLVELLIRKHCEEAGISIPEQQSLFQDEDNEREDSASTD